MRPAFTSSRNCEYSIGACAAWRVLNWLNTVINTSPMTSQMTRFLSMLFNDLLLFSRLRLRTIHLTRIPRDDIGFAGLAARGFRLTHVHFAKVTFQTFQDLVERLSLERFQHENTVGFQGFLAEIHRRERKLGGARLIDVWYARQVRQDVGKNDIGALSLQGLKQSRFAKVASEHGHVRYGGNFKEINSNHLAAGLHLAGRDLRPTARRCTKIDHDQARPKQPFAFIELDQLVGRARAIALLFR